MGGVPQIDFSPLGDLGNVYQRARQQATRDQVLGQLGQGSGPLDFGAASKALLAAGDTEGGLSLAKLAQQQYLTSPEYITQSETAKAKVAEQFAPKTTDITTPGGEKVTVQKGPTGYTIPQIQGMPPPDPNLPPGVDPKIYRETRTKQLANIDDKALLEADKNVQAGALVKKSLQRALALNDQAYSGPFAEGRGYIGSQFGMHGGEATQELTNVVTNQALDNLRATFGGNPTEGERKILLQVQGAASQSPAVRKTIYENAMQAAEARTAFNQKIADDMRSGKYLLPESQRGPQPGAAPSTPGPQTQADPNAWKSRETIAAARANQQQTLAEAQAVIAKNPAARDQVIQRLKAVGIDPSGLTAPAPSPTAGAIY
jgi:hypothetical protein